MTIREIATGLRFPEGPVAMSDGSVVEALEDGAELKGFEKIVGDLDAFIILSHDAEDAVADKEALAAGVAGPEEIFAFCKRLLFEGIEKEPTVFVVNGMVILKPCDEGVVHTRKYPNFRANDHICH